MLLTKTLLFSKKEVIPNESRIPKIAVCCVKVDNIKLFRKHCTKSDHKHLTRSHMSKDVSWYKLQKEQSVDDFIAKILSFLLRNRTLFKILN